MSVRDLINAIIDSEADQIQSSFKEEMTSRIIDRLEEMKGNIAENMFKHAHPKYPHMNTNPENKPNPTKSHNPNTGYTNDDGTDKNNTTDPNSPNHIKRSRQDFRPDTTFTTPKPRKPSESDTTFTTPKPRKPSESDTTFTTPKPGKYT